MNNSRIKNYGQLVPAIIYKDFLSLSLLDKSAQLRERSKWIKKTP
jgi:hypothetical protein